MLDKHVNGITTVGKMLLAQKFQKNPEKLPKMGKEMGMLGKQ
jgi:hypothetical protein